jgi:hypothetical protein
VTHAQERGDILGCRCHASSTQALDGDADESLIYRRERRVPTGTRNLNTYRR